MNVVLLSTYDLGHQPFGVASPAAWLREQGHTVRCVDLALDALPAKVIREAEVVAFFVPMHTATRLAADAIKKVRLLHPGVRMIAYGLYAPMNGEYLRELGVESVVGGEFEAGLLEALSGPVTAVSRERLQFRVPDRMGLPVLGRYPKLRKNGAGLTVGYTEASRGCKHLCRHCPVVPVYQGVFRVVPVEIVLSDIRAQVAAGAQHITFGDPDFWNGPGHARRIVAALHAEFPELTYDVIIKIEHLLQHRELLPELVATGCLFVTSAVEAVDDGILRILDKGHTRADFAESVRLCREAGLTMSPTFVPFTPWTTLEGYRDLLRAIRDLDLVDAVAPVQLALRLLLPAGSLLLEREETKPYVTGFDRAALLWRWKHADEEMDLLAGRLLRLVSKSRASSRREVFGEIWREAMDERLPEEFGLLPRAAIPYLDEPWYC